MSLLDLEEPLRNLQATAQLLRHLGCSPSCIEPEVLDRIASMLEQDIGRLQAAWQAELKSEGTAEAAPFLALP